MEVINSSVRVVVDGLENRTCPPECGLLVACRQVGTEFITAHKEVDSGVSTKPHVESMLSGNVRFSVDLDHALAQGCVYCRGKDPLNGGDDNTFLITESNQGLAIEMIASRQKPGSN
jgi:hypothetical protein